MNNIFKNMIRVGSVSSVNYENGSVKVVFKDKDDIVTKDLPVLSFEYYMPKVNDPVLCVFLGNGVQNGFCLGKYFNELNKPSIYGANIYKKDFFGEASLQYNRETKVLTIEADKIILNSSEIEITGDLHITGNLYVNQDLSVTGNINYGGSINDTSGS